MFCSWFGHFCQQNSYKLVKALQYCGHFCFGLQSVEHGLSHWKQKLKVTFHVQFWRVKALLCKLDFEVCMFPLWCSLFFHRGFNPKVGLQQLTWTLIKWPQRSQTFFSHRLVLTDIQLCVTKVHKLAMTFNERWCFWPFTWKQRWMHELPGIGSHTFSIWDPHKWPLCVGDFQTIWTQPTVPQDHLCW